MKLGRLFVLVLSVAVFSAVLGGPVCAETLQKQFPHKLASAYPVVTKIFEDRVDLPDAWAKQGWRFLKRAIKPSGKLVIEREELTATYYYVRVKMFSDVMDITGQVDVTLEGGPALALPAAPEPCTSLSAKAPALRPFFSWSGSNAFTLVSLMEKSTGSTIWERLVLNASKAHVDEGALKVGSHYLWAVKHGDEFGRYSAQTVGAFRIEGRIVDCTYCKGKGKVTCPTCDGQGSWAVPSNPPGSWEHKICMDCNGSGEVKCRPCRGSGKTEALDLCEEQP